MKAKFLLLMAIFLFLIFTGASASAYTIKFVNITNNGSQDVASQLSAKVTAVDSLVTFHFINDGTGTPIASSITDIYFDDAVPGILSSPLLIIASSSGVSFTSSATPPVLPGGNTIGFVTAFSTNSTTPIANKGINPGEWLEISFNLAGDNEFNDLLNAIGSQDFRIGLHVQAIGLNNGSDSFVSTPLPPAILLFGSGLIGLAGLRRKKKIL